MLLKFYLLLLFLLLWPCCAACGILVPQPGIEPTPPAMEVLDLNHWEVPSASLFNTKPKASNSPGLEWIKDFWGRLDISLGCRNQGESCREGKLSENSWEIASTAALSHRESPLGVFSFALMRAAVPFRNPLVSHLRYENGMDFSTVYRESEWQLHHTPRTAIHLASTKCQLVHWEHFPHGRWWVGFHSLGCLIPDSSGEVLVEGTVVSLGKQIGQNPGIFKVRCVAQISSVSCSCLDSE